MADQTGFVDFSDDEIAVVDLREGLPFEQLLGEVLSYMRAHPGAGSPEAAFALDISFDDAERAAVELVQRGVLRTEL